MEGEKYERTMSCDIMGSRPTTKVCVREFTIHVNLRNDICYSLKCREDAKGQDIMDEMCDKLGIVEKDYFGLQYFNRSNEAHWLNMRNKVFKQVNKNEQPCLLFRVKFYVQPHQLLQESSRKQFFLNVKFEIMNGKYNASISKMPRLYALISQVEAGRFKENHISYNPSRTSEWDSEFRTKVILEHCKLEDMSPEVAEFFCLKEVAELEEYGMEYCTVRTEDNHNTVEFGIGIDSIRIDHGDEIQSVPYTCLRKSTHDKKTVKLNIVVSDSGETETVVYRLNTKESAIALYRSITEHYAFYRCDSVRPAVKEQVARDIFDTILSWFHEDSQNYIFDTERTCREAYDHARRTLYNFGSTAAADMTQSKVLSRETSHDEGNSLEGQVLQLKEDLRCFTEAFHCSVCRDAVVDVVLQCGHLICSSCGQICQECPFCRVHIISKTKFYLPINLAQNSDTEQQLAVQTFVDCQCTEME